MITRITTRGRIYCFEKWIFFFAAQEICTKDIYRTTKNTEFSSRNYPYSLTVMKTEKPTFIFILYIFLSGVCVYAKLRKICGRVHKSLLFFTIASLRRRRWLHCINIIFSRINLSTLSNRFIWIVNATRPQCIQCYLQSVHPVSNFHFSDTYIPGAIFVVKIILINKIMIHRL